MKIKDLFAKATRQPAAASCTVNCERILATAAATIEQPNRPNVFMVICQSQDLLAHTQYGMLIELIVCIYFNHGFAQPLAIMIDTLLIKRYRRTWGISKVLQVSDDGFGMRTIYCGSLR